MPLACFEQHWSVVMSNVPSDFEAKNAIKINTKTSLNLIRHAWNLRIVVFTKLTGDFNLAEGM